MTTSESGEPIKRAFISHVREDSGQVAEICKALEVAGIPYWLDRDQLDPGDDWRDQIRQAIRSGSLAFLACYSPNSACKARSYMREEVQLAIEEYRLRPPGKPWLIPVLLGTDAEIPDVELSTTRRMADLQAVRLFAEDHQNQMIRLVMTVADIVKGERPSAATARAAVDQASTAEQRAERVLGLTKAMITDPSRRIELDDLIAGEVRRITALMADPDWISGDLGSTDVEQLAAIAGRAQRMWDVTEPFCASLFVASRWAEPEQLGPWVSGLKSLGAAADRVQGGYDSQLSMRRLPAVAALMTIGLAAVSAERWPTLKVLVADLMVRNARYNTTEPLLRFSYPWAPFGNEQIGNVVARTVREDEDPLIAARAVVNDRRRYRTPPAEWLHKVLRPFFADVLADDEFYDLEFDRAEIVLGLIGQDQYLQHKAANPDGNWIYLPHWFGRAAWRSGYGHSSPLADLETGLATQGSSWGPLRAGMFGASVERATAALGAYRAAFEDRRHHMY